jgi:sugar lactone lactonase YvrE
MCAVLIGWMPTAGAGRSYAVSVFGPVPAPGHPFGVLATKDAVYATTSAVSPLRPDSGEQVVLRYPTDGGAPVARSTVQTAPDMGLFGAAEDAEGRIYVVDMNGRILRFTPNGGGLAGPEVYATDPYRELGWKASMWMNPVFDRKGNLYVIDASQGAIWRIPPSRTPAVWFQDPRIAGHSAGANGMTLGPDRKLYFPLADGPLYRLPLTTTSPRHDQLELFHEFTVEPGAHDTPLPGPIDVAFGRSGRLYVTLASADRIAVLAPDGNVLREITSDAFDYPLGVRFQGRSLLVANSNFLGQENQAHWAILKVFVGESGLPLIRPTLP